MSHPLVKNIRTYKGPGIYIGRKGCGETGYFGNPFSHLPGTQAKFRVSTRDEACDKFAEWAWREMLSNREYLRQVLTLEGKVLICFCAPARCHGEEIIQLIERWKHNCCVCHRNWVDTEGGFDTCKPCLRNV